MVSPLAFFSIVCGRVDSGAVKWLVGKLVAPLFHRNGFVSRLFGKEFVRFEYKFKFVP